MASGAEIAKEILATDGIGTFAATSGWSIAIAREPEAPHTCITIFDVGGAAPFPHLAFDFPSIQVRVRGAPNGYVAARAKIDACKTALLGRSGFTAADTSTVDGIIALSDVQFLSFDQSDRPVLVANYRMFIRPPASGQREAL